jgi:3-oxoacyl-[acyl-carrier protein] reductase
MSRKSKGRPVAVVTGGGRRLGRRIAHALAERGFDLVVCYKSSEGGARAMVKSAGRVGSRAIAVKMDVSKRNDVRRMVKKIRGVFGRADVLVNNAGIFPHAPAMTTSDRLWDEVMNTNLRGHFICSQEVAKIMLKNGGGRIINIASLGGIQAWHRHTPYSVSKAGVIMLTRCFAKALAPSVMVNAIAPGTIILDGEEDPETLHIPIHGIPLRRYGKSSDITDLVLYLSTVSQYITGQTIAVDGGRSI